MGAERGRARALALAALVSALALAAVRSWERGALRVLLAASEPLGGARVGAGGAGGGGEGWVREGGDRTDALDCSLMPLTSVSGDVAFTWGTGEHGFRVGDAAECCDACRAHARVCAGEESDGQVFWTPTRGSGEARCNKDARACNVWAYCPLARCFSFDVHVHEQYECWLKHDPDPANPAAGTSGAYPAAMRAAPRERWPWAVATDVWPGQMPEMNTWLSGALLPRGSPPARAKPPHTLTEWCARDENRGSCDTRRSRSSHHM